jgi:hypothetical protein
MKRLGELKMNSQRRKALPEPNAPKPFEYSNGVINQGFEGNGFFQQKKEDVHFTFSIMNGENLKGKI